MELARRVGLLLATFYAGQETDAVADTVLAGVAAKGCNLSREDRNAILTGAPSSCDDEQTLSVLGEVLGVVVPYVSRRNPERDDRFEAQLDLLRVMKEHNVTNFHACGPGGAFRAETAEDIRLITNIISEHGPAEESDIPPGTW